MKSENCHRTASPPDLAPLMVTLCVMILKIMMLAILLGYQQLEDSHSIIVYQLPISIV